MEKCLKLASLLAIGLFAVGVIACKQPTGNVISGGGTGGGNETPTVPSTPTTPGTGESGGSTETPTEPSADFVEVSGHQITGTETWTPSSYVFVSCRKITIRDLIVCTHEVTQKEYETYCKYGSYLPSDITHGKGDDFPAYWMSWYDAIVYCNLRSIAEGLTPVYKLGDKTNPADWNGIQGNETEKYCGPSSDNSDWNAITMDIEANGYRLPTEAEWEYLARGGETTSTEYSGSDKIDEVAWYSNNSDSKTHAVKGKKPNALGLYDMSGNVDEWCWDWSDWNSITSSTPETGAASGSYRYRRGGSWYDNASDCSVSYRGYNYPYYRSGNYGFRVVRTAKAN